MNILLHMRFPAVMPIKATRAASAHFILKSPFDLLCGCFSLAS